MPELVLITGGVRSGKSGFATQLASGMGKQITFIATATALDEEMRERIISHQKSRPHHWQLIEEQKAVASALAKINCPERVVIVDCLTFLVSNLLLEEKKEQQILKEVEEIAYMSGTCNKATIVVSNEVGWGVVPPTKLGRKFRDIAGRANQIMASRASRVYLLVCGVAQKIKEEK